MIFFFGSRASHIKSKILDFEICPNCKQQNRILCTVYGHYTHLFWIPLFPTSTTVQAQCQNCGAQWGLSAMTPEIKQAAIRFRSEQRRPLLHFTGLILFALLFGFITFGAYVANKNKQLYLADPQVYDCYMLRNTENGYYTYARIEEIDGDTIWVSFNEYSFSSTAPLKQYNRDEYFSEDWYPYLKDELDFLDADDGYTLRQIIRRKPSE